MNSVTVYSDGADLITPMAQMRDWLDSRGIVPIKFGYETVDGAIVFYLDFAVAAEAAAFAAAFGGEVLSACQDRAA